MPYGVDDGDKNRRRLPLLFIDSVSLDELTGCTVGFVGNGEPSEEVVDEEALLLAASSFIDGALLDELTGGTAGFVGGI
ncbi:hypothetical protein FACS1894122_05570 [Alphaproteobacteria bacterium]|nr:hypothetical protein FACS1894122_05570 [Alphaproteobacteria bacterium]